MEKEEEEVVEDEKKQCKDKLCCFSVALKLPLQFHLVLKRRKGGKRMRRKMRRKKGE